MYILKISKKFLATFSQLKVSLTKIIPASPASEKTGKPIKAEINWHDNDGVLGCGTAEYHDGRPPAKHLIDCAR